MNAFIPLSRVDGIIEQLEDALDENSLKGIGSLPLLSDGAAQTIQTTQEATRARMGQLRDGLALAAKLRTRRDEKKVECGLSELEYEKASAERYLETAMRIVDESRGGHEQSMAVLTNVEEAKNIEIEYSTLTDDDRTATQTQVDEGVAFLKELDEQIEDLYEKTKVDLETSEYENLQGLVPGVRLAGNTGQVAA